MDFESAPVRLRTLNFSNFGCCYTHMDHTITHVRGAGGCPGLCGDGGPYSGLLKESILY